MFYLSTFTCYCHLLEHVEDLPEHPGVTLCLPLHHAVPLLALLLPL